MDAPDRISDGDFGHGLFAVVRGDTGERVREATQRRHGDIGRVRDCRLELCDRRAERFRLVFYALPYSHCVNWVIPTVKLSTGTYPAQAVLLRSEDVNAKTANVTSKASGIDVKSSIQKASFLN
ncbi:hypothetical protein PQQ77_29365 [Paraburkholderia strydomiana]|uniref:hypothetical protein n=1 Tax=Paraburkholderia strydomiana TaxID=1245417 RepID=UPI0038BBA32A